jgi:hypothetical protein
LEHDPEKGHAQTKKTERDGSNKNHPAFKGGGVGVDISTLLLLLIAAFAAASVLNRLDRRRKVRQIE